MKKKNLFLGLALVLPVLVFVFLKYFGKNQFEIPVYHQSKVDRIEGCDLDYQAPYKVPDSTLISLGWDSKRAILILFHAMSGENKLRLEQEVQQSKLQVVLNEVGGEGASGKLFSCVLLLPNKFNAVLVDDQKQIRGYYEIDSREELDRLLVELKILFNEY